MQSIELRFFFTSFAMAVFKVARNIHRLYIGNLPWTIGNRELRNYFQKFGRVANSSVIFDKKTGLSRGYGFVNYFSLNPIEKIENESRHILEGNQLRIQKQ